MTLEYLLQRYSDDSDSTLGLLFKEISYAGKPKLHFVCDVLEDEFRSEKVMHETRIPAGRYELKILKQDTPLTLKHRKSYGSWFKYHIMLSNVPNFSGIYIHAGNTDSDTSGCLLLGYGSQRINGVQSINNSRLACKDFYNECYEHLDFVHPKPRGGEQEVNRAFITIRDEQFIIK